MKKTPAMRVVFTALLAGMVCISTMLIQIASPLGGYIHLGDALVLMCAFLLGPLRGSLAAGIGSMLADVLTGYMHYAPGTLLIKAGCALIAALLLRTLDKRAPALPQTLRMAAAALPAELFMVLGYLLYAWFPLSHGPGAIASVPGNLVQGAAGMVIAALVTPQIIRPKEVREILERLRGR